MLERASDSPRNTYGITLAIPARSNPLLSILQIDEENSFGRR